jgi:hypothetical protein
MCASPQSAMLESTGSSERPFAQKRIAGIEAALRIRLREPSAPSATKEPP